MKNKKVAVLLSLLFPGLGHLYIGKYVDGIIFLIAALVLWLITFLRSEFILRFNNQTIILPLVLIGLYIYTIFDLYRKVEKI